MTIKLYNSLTRQKEIFQPLRKDKVGMYVCGPTVYDYPHLGNALAVVIYDVLFRLLILIYGKDKVCYVRNITDVDDKIIKAAHEQNISIHQLTHNITEIFTNNISELNCLKPNFEPKATEHIQDMIEMIQKLLANKFAYLSNDHVYFDISKFDNYYKLSGRDSSKVIHGVRVNISENKHNNEDFVLWKPSKDLDHSFNSPFGKGRPGWHIECSSMSTRFLGNDFDIHGGGVDLIFPHHTNEIAQSCCANPGTNYAKYWIHNGFLTVNGEKMSKSLGNFITINDLLKQGVQGEVIRYVLLSSHYRKPLDWNIKSLHDVQKTLDSFYNLLDENKLSKFSKSIPQEFLDCLYDDLNTPKAFAIMHTYFNQYQKTNDQSYIDKLYNCGKLLGFFSKTPDEWFKKSSIDKNFILEQIEIRNQAKKEKNWTIADQVRSDLQNKNIILEDHKDGTTTWKITNKAKI